MSFLVPEGLKWQDNAPTVIEQIWVGWRLDLRVQHEWTMVMGGRTYTISAPGWVPCPPPMIADWQRQAVA